MPAAARRRWFVGYVEQIITRDVPAVAPRRNPELLRQYLSVLMNPRYNRAIADDAMRRFEPNVTCGPGSGRQGIGRVRAVLEGCPPRYLDRNAASTAQRYHGCAKRSPRFGRAWMR